MSNISRTDWSRIDAITDEAIDTSDILLFGDEFFLKAKLRMPSSLATVVFVFILRLWHGFNQRVNVLEINYDYVAWNKKLYEKSQ